MFQHCVIFVLIYNIRIMAITTEQIKSLRERTGISVMQVKKALEEAGGDEEKAIILLQKKGSEIAAKKAERTLGAGAVVACIDDKSGVIMELDCETDFVARNPEFRVVAEKIAKSILTEGKNKDDFEAEVSGVVQKFGEKTEIVKVEKIEMVDAGVLVSYIHFSGDVGTLVYLKTTSNDAKVKEIANNIAMQITAQNPSYLSETEISDEEKEKVKILLSADVDTSKPKEIQEKILAGKVAAYFKEKVLLNQEYILDPEKTITQLLATTAKEVGTDISIVKFVRLSASE